MITLEEALEIYNASPASYRAVDRYIPYKGGFILIAKENGTVGCHHVWVKSNGEIGYTNPLIEPYGKKKPLLI